MKSEIKFADEKVQKNMELIIFENIIYRKDGD